MGQAGLVSSYTESYSHIFFPSSTKGLDASTALEFARALRIATDLLHVSTIVSIYQAGETLYNIFDKVCVIYEGRMAYFGPASEARQYFIDMGYKPANRQTTPDFLISVTDPEGRTESNIDEESVFEVSGHDQERRSQRSSTIGIERRRPIPRTAIEFAEYYKQSGIRQLNIRDMEDYKEHFVGKPELEASYKESSRAEHARHTRKKVHRLCLFQKGVLTLLLEPLHYLDSHASKNCDEA